MKTYKSMGNLLYGLTLDQANYLVKVHKDFANKNGKNYYYVREYKLRSIGLNKSYSRYRINVETENGKICKVRNVG